MGRIDTNAVAIGAAVRGALAAAGYSIAESAPALEMSVNTLSRRINGSLPFTWPEVVRVSVLTNTPCIEIVASAERIRVKRELEPTG